MRLVQWAAAGFVLAAAAPVQAQPDGWLSAETTTDHRRRGVSWSEGRAAAELSAGIQPMAGIRLDSAIATLRNSARHGGADAVTDLSVGVSHGQGPVRVDAGMVAHVFSGGRGRLNFVELTMGAGTLIGPVGIDVGLSYAPDQSAIGGDNLYVYARGEAAVIGTPLTLNAAIGRSTGATNDPLRAARLRPGGAYTDWTLGVDNVSGPLTIGLSYVGNDAPAAIPGSPPELRHTGDTVVARVRISL